MWPHYTCPGTTFCIPTGFSTDGPYTRTHHNHTALLWELTKNLVSFGTDLYKNIKPIIARAAAWVLSLVSRWHITNPSLFLLTWPLGFAPAQCYYHQFKDNCTLLVLCSAWRWAGRWSFTQWEGCSWMPFDFWKAIHQDKLLRRMEHQQNLFETSKPSLLSMKIQP